MAKKKEEPTAPDEEEAASESEGEVASETAEPEPEEAPKEEAAPEPAEPAPEPEEAGKEPPAKEEPAPELEEAPKEEAAPKPEEAPPPAPKPEEDSLIPAESLLLFDTWDLTGITVSDPGLQRYINLSPVVIPHTSARHVNKPFAKARTNIVERLINSMMRTEKYTGKKMKTYVVVRDALAILEKRGKANPVQVLVDALANAAPREEITRLRFGGISVPRAVDIAPSRRLDVALRNISIGAVTSSHKSRKPIAQSLADEILAAAQGDINSFSISKKEDMERVAASAR